MYFFITQSGRWTDALSKEAYNILLSNQRKAGVIGSTPIRFCYRRYLAGAGAVSGADPMNCLTVWVMSANV